MKESIRDLISIYQEAKEAAKIIVMATLILVGSLYAVTKNSSGVQRVIVMMTILVIGVIIPGYAVLKHL